MTSSCVSCIFRYERLEEQLNDLTELHQNEMTNLKQELASMEEKVAYQSYERARDIQVKTRALKYIIIVSNNNFRNKHKSIHLISNAAIRHSVQHHRFISILSGAQWEEKTQYRNLNC